MDALIANCKVTESDLSQQVLLLRFTLHLSAKLKQGNPDKSMSLQD